MAKVKQPEPLEFEEQVAVVEWIETQNMIAELTKKPRVLFSAIANGHYQASHKQRRKLVEEGMRSGVPDLLFVIPPERAKTGKAMIVYIEMKRRTQGAVSKEQRAWIDGINQVSGSQGVVGAFVCRGAKEAIDTLKDLIIVL